MLSLKKLLTAALLIFVVSIVGKAEAGIVTDKMPLQCYVDHKVTSYDLNSGQAVGWIDAEVDLVQIEEIGGNGVARGTHPGRNGTVRRLFWARDVFADTNYANRPAHVNGYHEVYRTSSSGSTIGSVRDEDVTVVADNGNRAQIVYRLDNGTGYKMGWVPSSIVPPPTPPTPPSNNYAQPEDGDYYIVPINSTCAIDVPNNWHDEGTVLHIYNKNDSPAQTFRLERVGNGWYKIIHKDSGNVMNVQYGNNGNGTRLWLYHYDGSASCHWRFRDLGGGVYNIESQLSSNPFLEVQNGNPFNGAVLQLWQQHTGDAAKWRLVKANSPQQNVSGGSTTDGLLYPMKGSISVTPQSMTLKNSGGIKCDYTAPQGENTEIRAPSDGWVEFRQTYSTKYNAMISYANHIIFTATIGNDTYEIKCCHLSRFVSAPNDSRVKQKTLTRSSGRGCGESDKDPDGETYGAHKATIILGNTRVRVSKNQLLGYAGMTGNANGVHVHMEVRKNGQLVDPKSVFKTW